MLTKRFVLPLCFVLSGLLLDAEWTQYSHHFNSVCAESGNSLTASWFFTALMLIPASASLILLTNRVYLVACLGIWLCHMALQYYMIAEANWLEAHAGINCYKRVGSGEFVSLLLATLFTAAIIVTTLGFSTACLARSLLRQITKRPDIQGRPNHNVSCSRLVQTNPQTPKAQRLADNALIQASGHDTR